MRFSFKGVLTEHGWLKNRCLITDNEGILVSIEKNDLRADYYGGYALPGFQNAHSHAFQFAMAGMAENHTAARSTDDFWTWRKAMYEVALHITPEELEEIATVLYRTMVRNGYTSVAEFHYLHHDQNGRPYDNPAEMGERLIAAAKNAGIRLTLIPIFYQQGNFKTAADPSQRRFLSKDLEAYYRLVEESRRAAGHYMHARIGTGIHSLRAAKEADIIEYTDQLTGNEPFHMHIAEQLKEVEDCVRSLRQRPVEWLLDHCNIGPHCNLVHATHLNDGELSGIAQAGAHVVLCPSTEGNLGDGIFMFHDYKKQGGSWCIGTDSHIGLDPFEELRLLDYGQRLTTHRRDTFITENCADNGLNALKMAWLAGRAAMGEVKQEKWFNIGQPLDVIDISDESTLLNSTGSEFLASTLVYTTCAHHIRNVIINGRIISTSVPERQVFQDIRNRLAARVK